jgi:hypothetical protein
LSRPQSALSGEPPRSHMIRPQPGVGNHVDLRGLPGGAKGIRTDGTRRSIRIPARPSEFLQDGATLTCVPAPKTGSLLVSRPWPWTCAVAARTASWKRWRAGPIWR